MRKQSAPLARLNVTTVPTEQAASAVTSELILPLLNFCLALVVRRIDLREIMSTSYPLTPAAWITYVYDLLLSSS